MIEVVSLPPLATIQDLGRTGFWDQGLGSAGAMDPLAHRIANMLLGNDDNAATLEIPLTPAKFEFHEDTVFSLVGAACRAKLDGLSLPRCWCGKARAGQVLELGAIIDGARVYLGLPGGIDVPEILNSRSTQLREAFGGLEGRVLKAGDILKGFEHQKTQPAGLSVAMLPVKRKDTQSIALRVLASAETYQFAQSSLDAFFSQPYKVTPQSNRQGYRLDGPELERIQSGELRSHGIAPGIIQVPGGGQPIIQLADAATMGGYPKIACVIEEDLWRIGQARPGDLLCFELVDREEACRVANEMARYLEETRKAIKAAKVLHESWK